MVRKDEEFFTYMEELQTLRNNKYEYESCKLLLLETQNELQKQNRFCFQY